MKCSLGCLQCLPHASPGEMILTQPLGGELPHFAAKIFGVLFPQNLVVVHSPVFEPDSIPCFPLSGSPPKEEHLLGSLDEVLLVHVENLVQKANKISISVVPSYVSSLPD